MIQYNIICYILLDDGGNHIQYCIHTTFNRTIEVRALLLRVYVYVCYDAKPPLHLPTPPMSTLSVLFLV